MPVSYDKRGAIGVVTLSRPQARNAWGPDFNEGLARHFAAMEDDDEIRCAILTGDEAGGAFSAGANLKDPRTHTQDSAAEFIKSIAKRRGRAFEVLGEFPKPIIGAVNGYAVGIGCIITFCCDLLVASEKAEWRLPQVALGILPAYGGGVRLARWVGRGRRCGSFSGSRSAPRKRTASASPSGSSRMGSSWTRRSRWPDTSRPCRRWPPASRRSPCCGASTSPISPTPRWSISTASWPSS